MQTLLAILVLAVPVVGLALAALLAASAGRPWFPSGAGGSAWDDVGPREVRPADDPADGPAPVPDGHPAADRPTATATPVACTAPACSS